MEYLILLSYIYYLQAIEVLTSMTHAEKQDKSEGFDSCYQICNFA